VDGSEHRPRIAQTCLPARAITRRLSMSFLEVLQRITAALDRVGIAYMLTGSFASVYYGSPCSTQHIDLVIAANPAQLRAFIESLPPGEYYADLDAALEAHKRESLFPH
jgi:hypothetical protein